MDNSPTSLVVERCSTPVSSLIRSTAHLATPPPELSVIKPYMFAVVRCPHAECARANNKLTAKNVLARNEFIYPPHVSVAQVGSDSRRRAYLPVISRRR